MKKRRLLSLLICLLMVLTMLPAATFVSSAASMTAVSVSSGSDLKNYLGSSGNYNITLTKDIDYNETGDYSYWCTISGTNAINLNGHVLLVSNDWVSSSTMFNIPSGAALTVYDTANSSNSTIKYNGYINDAGTVRTRDIFDVSGSLTVNGGKVEAGRSKSFYSAKYACTVYKQTMGTGVRVRNGGVLTVNGGTIFGRGANVRKSALVAQQGAKVYFNAGSVKAKGGANCFSIVSSSSVRVATGTFTCEKLDAIKCNGSITQGIGYGAVHLENATFAPNSSPHYTTNSLETSTNLTIYSSGKYTPLEVNSGNKITAESNDSLSIILSSSDPVVRTSAVPNGDPYGYQFKNVDTQTPGLSYSMQYSWAIWKDSSTPLAEIPFSSGKSSVNVMTDFPGFTPEKGVTYYLRASYREYLQDQHFQGNPQTVYLTVVDDLAAPTIKSQPPATIGMQVGGSGTISVSASGSNLSYQWYYSSDGGSHWTAVITGRQRVLSISGATADMNGRLYRCRVSNSAGTVRSNTCQVVINPTALSRIDLFDLDQPVMGEPLDFTAGSTTKGVTVSNVEWEILLGDKLTDNAPAAGMTVTVDCTVRLAAGYSFANPCNAYLNGVKQVSSGAPTNTEKQFSFSFRVAAPTGGAVIDTAYLDFEHGNEPAVGAKPEYLVIRKLEAYDDAYRRDVRYDDNNDTWFREDGSVMPFSETFEAGRSYTVQTTLTPNTAYGWKFTSASTAELNGEEMDVKLDGQNLIVRRTFSLADDSTAEPDPGTNPGTDPGTGFTDVTDPNDYFYEPVKWAVANGITEGISPSEFGPYFLCTRAQAVTFLWRANGKPEPTSSYNPFTDVTTEDYFYKPVLWAVEKGITNGVDAHSFGPSIHCSRGHIVTFLWRSKGQPEPTSMNNPFIDVSASDYYYKPVLWAVEAGVTNGTSPNTFSPNDYCTRGQIVTFLYRAK